MFSDQHFYIDLNWETFLESPETYVQNAYLIVDLIYHHKANVYFNNDQISQFKEISSADINYMHSIGNKLQLLLENALKVDSSYFPFEVVFANTQSCLNPVVNSTISSMDSRDKMVLISFSENEQTKTLLNIRSNTEFFKIDFEIINNSSSIINWIVRNSRERVFNTSDKHGENGIGNWINESVLLCDKQKAQGFLNLAIPELRKKENHLYFFDEDEDTYLEFYYEGDNPQNQWHGFHITHEEWEQRIPSSIRKYFRK